MTYEEIKKQRFQFLYALYDYTRGSISHRIPVGRLYQYWHDEHGDLHGIKQLPDDLTILAIMEYLASEGLIMPRNSHELFGTSLFYPDSYKNYWVSITHKGIKEIEQAKENPQTPTQNFPANIVYNALEGQGPPSKESQEITVFISYAREDSNAAKRLHNDLRSAGLSPWLDKESLIAGQNWKIAINKAIKKSRYFIPIFSSISVAKRGYVQKEFRYALDVLDEFPESQIFVIPVRLDDCEIPYEKLKDIEYVDLFPDWGRGLQRIVQATKNSN